MKKNITLLTLLFTMNLAAANWGPYTPASLNFSIPHPYAAKEVIQHWYVYKFYDSLKVKEQELIDLIELNTSDPIFCTKLTVGSITTNFCNPWVIGIMIKDGQYYLTHRRYKFFGTLNHMEVLKMNFGIEGYDEFHKYVIPFASRYLAQQLSPEQQLVLSFYYMYDYQIKDNCSSYECEDKTRLKRKHKLHQEDGQYTSYSWIHRTLLSGCKSGGSCITAREITYTVSIDEPTVWRSSAHDTTFKNNWSGSYTWNRLKENWVSGKRDITDFNQSSSSSTEIINLPLP